MFHADLHGLRIDLNMTRYGGDQIILKGIKLSRSQIRAVMDKDKLQAFLGALRAVLSSEQSIEEAHVTSSPSAAGDVPISSPDSPGPEMERSLLANVEQYFGKPVPLCSSYHEQPVHRGSSQ